jgi:L,D-peptidoglycan transpeptidase YkuD (ErfK/YbiS/YcfS/YnhG family)
MRKALTLILIVFLPSCASAPKHGVLDTLDPEHRQVVIVRKDQGVFVCSVSVWQKEDGRWRQVLRPMRGVAGRRGIAPSGEKREGDGRTPSGTFDLKLAFGYEPSLDTQLDYRQADEDDLWVDDAGSPQYNQWVKAPTEAQSFENMKRKERGRCDRIQYRSCGARVWQRDLPAHLARAQQPDGRVRRFIRAGCPADLEPFG